MKKFLLLLIFLLMGISNLVAQITITNVSWSNISDQDGDGYSRSRTMNVTIQNTGGNISAILEIRAWPDGSAEALYCNTTNFAVLGGVTATYTVPVGTNSDCGGELSHATYDLRVLLRASVNGTIYAQRGPSDDNDLNNENFETAAEDVQATYSIDNVTWSGQVDVDTDGYTRSRTMNVTITASENTSGILEIRAWPDGQAETLYGNTTSFAVSGGTFAYTVPIGTGSDIGGELSHNTYDFRALLRTGVGGTILAQRGPNDDSDLNNENFETATEDILTIDNVTWSNQIDPDGDGYTSSRTMNLTITAGNSAQMNLELRAWPDGASEVLYGNVTIDVSAGTGSYPYTIGTGSSIGSELSHNSYDFRALLRAGINGTIYTQRGPNDDSDLNNELFETAADEYVSITITTNASGRSFTVEGQTYTTPQTFSWTPGTQKQIGTTSLQAGTTGTQYVWNNWSDGGAMNHTITVPNGNATYTANFTTQYYLTMVASPPAGGTVSPQSGWYNSGTQVPISATINNGYFWNGWTGSGTVSYTGTNNPANVTMNSPITETANFGTNPQITITTNPSGRSFTVEGQTYTTPQTFSWTPGTQKQIGTTSLQAGTTGTQYVWNNWSDGGAMNHTITVPNGNATYTANFTTQYYLTMVASPPAGGTVSPQSGWYNSGTQVPISATINNGYFWNGWTGSGTVSYTGTNNPANVTMNSPITETANFGTNPQITITTNPSGRSFTVEGQTYTTPQTFSWTPGTQKQIGTSSPQAGTTGTQYVWNNWSDGGAMNHTITVPGSNSTYTANFTTQYYLTMAANPSNGGTVSPQSGWYNAGTPVQISANANNGYFFSGWTGTGTGSYTGSNNPADINSIAGPITETANFSTTYIPVAYSATDITSTTFIAHWSNCQGVTGYKLDVTNDSTFSNFQTWDRGIDTFYNVTGLQSNKNYFYRVRAKYGSIISDPSNIISLSTLIVGIDKLDMISGIPDNYSLSNNYPNPFNPSTKIQFGLPEESNSTLKVYDILGSEVITLLDNETLSAGSYSYNLVADGLPSGIYVYVLTTKSNSSQKSFRDVKKMILLK